MADLETLIITLFTPLNAFSEGGGQNLSLSRHTSDAVVVWLSPAGLSQPLSHEEGDSAQKTSHNQDEQLPVQQQVVAVVEGQSGHDGLYELEDGEGGSAVVPEYGAQDAEELSVEAAVTEAEQEAAE